MADNIDAWRRLHPEWSIKVWTERDLGWLENSGPFRDARSIVPDDAVGQFQADIARYEIILREGGFYADVDTRPVRPIDDSVLNHESFAVQEDRTWIGNTYVGARPGHPIMRDIVGGLRDNIRRNRGKRPNVLSGPKYITPIWVKHGGYVAPTEWGFPYSYSDVKRGTVPSTISDETYVVHEWDHTRRVMEARRGR